MILQNVENVERKCHRAVMKKDILVVVGTVTRSAKQFFYWLKNAII
jgi:hypothetical protein